MFTITITVERITKGINKDSNASDDVNAITISQLLVMIIMVITTAIMVTVIRYTRTKTTEKAPS